MPLRLADYEAGYVILGRRTGGRPYSAAEVEALSKASETLIDVAQLRH